MKKLLFVALVLTVPCLDAQELFNLWQEAYKNVNIYTYLSRTEMQEVNDTTMQMDPNQEKEYREIEKVLSHFAFDHHNDTLLFVLGYTYMTKYFPGHIFAQSSKSKQLFIRKTQQKLITEYPEPWYQLFYRGDVNGFRNYFRDKGNKGRQIMPCDYFGIALRICIKDGKMINPSEYWYFDDSFDFEEFIEILRPLTLSRSTIGCQ